jgi:hypothetical protein
MTQPTHFHVVDDFDAQSANGGKCYITHLPKMNRKAPQQQDHEIDEFILRGPDIDFEGYMDIRPVVIIETAREVFGMRTEEEYAELRESLEATERARVKAVLRAEAAEARADDLIVLNAEKIVTEQTLMTELETTYDDWLDDRRSEDE